MADDLPYKRLGIYTVDTGLGYPPGFWMIAKESIAPEGSPELRSVAFVVDPELGKIDTPHGSMTFIQAFGLHEDEVAALTQRVATPFLDAASRHLPLLNTNLERGSLLLVPEVVAAIESTPIEE